MCALGIIGGRIQKKKTLDYVLIWGLIAGTIVSFFFGWRQSQEEKNLFKETCQIHFEDGNYGLARGAILNRGLDDSTAQLLYGFLLTNGYGRPADPEKGWEYYCKAYMAGEPKAEDCLVVSSIKHFHDDRVTEVFKRAYNGGNAIAIKYLQHLLQEQGADYSDYDESSIWNLSDDELLSFLTFEQAKWIVSRRTYSISMPVSSTPSFSRKYLYSVGEDRMYYEEALLIPERFPEFFSEDPW